MATISFDQLSTGEVVTNQFSDISGVTFNTPGGVVISDPNSPFGLSLRAPKDGGAVEFPTWRIKGHFTTPTHSRIGFSVNGGVTITAKDVHGNVIGSTLIRSPKFTTDGSYFYGESPPERRISQNLRLAMSQVVPSQWRA